MKIKFIIYAMIGALFISSCKKDEEENTPQSTESNSLANTTGAATISVFPVRGKHNTGYDSQAGNTSSWNCDRGYSNSDFGGSHLGIDIWAPLGTPVAATVNGTLTLTGWSNYSGNKVTIKTSTGWYHFFCHLNSIAPGMVNGKTVTAGQIIGYVGKTGTASNGVVHLHYSLYPDGNYDAGINPWSRLYAVELDVCGTGGGSDLTIFDNFDGGVGHFYTEPTYSGSTVGISTASTATHYVSGSSTHLQVTLKDNTSSASSWKARLLSAEGISSKNKSVTRNGTIHFWIKTSTAQSGATAQIYVDDSDGLEASPAISIINDGAWHRYTWNLANFNGTNVSGGNGNIDGPNVTLDAIVLSQPNSSSNWTTYIDDVEHSTN